MVATGKTVNMQPELQFQMTVDVNGVDPNDHSQLMIGLAG